MKSEKVVIESPMSFAGSAKRAWRLTGLGTSWGDQANIWEKTARFALKLTLALVALALVAVWWIAIVCWYAVFGLLLVPWRLIRRGQRKEKRQKLQHREMMKALKKD